MNVTGMLLYAYVCVCSYFHACLYVWMHAKSKFSSMGDIIGRRTLAFGAAASSDNPQKYWSSPIHQLSLAWLLASHPGYPPRLVGLTKWRDLLPSSLSFFMRSLEEGHLESKLGFGVTIGKHWQTGDLTAPCNWGWNLVVFSLASHCVPSPFGQGMDLRTAHLPAYYFCVDLIRSKWGYTSPSTSIDFPKLNYSENTKMQENLGSYQRYTTFLIRAFSDIHIQTQGTPNPIPDEALSQKDLSLQRNSLNESLFLSNGLLYTTESLSRRKLLSTKTYPRRNFLSNADSPQKPTSQWSPIKLPSQWSFLPIKHPLNETIFLTNPSQCSRLLNITLLLTESFWGIFYNRSP